MKEEIKNNIICNNKIDIVGERDNNNNIIMNSKLNDLSNIFIIINF